MNPYEVLGVREDASDAEIKKAYRNLVKKYHPDHYKDNSMGSVAEEKIREINVAYDTIQKMRENGETYAQYSARTGEGNGYSGAEFNRYQQVVQDIRYGNLDAAQARLLQISETSRDAAWYYLMGEIAQRRGWYDSAQQYFTTAVQMEPANTLYRNALQNLYNRTNYYRQGGAQRGYDRGGNDLCNFCEALWCADCCCECAGGDLIRCC